MWSVNTWIIVICVAVYVVDGFNSMTFSHDSRYLYMGNGVGNHAENARLVVAERDPATGGLTFVQDFYEQSCPAYGAGGEAWSIAISPDGRHVYPASFDHLAVAALERDQETGRVSWAGDLPAGKFNSAAYVPLEVGGFNRLASLELICK